MESQDADVRLSAQRLRELMLWHGKDEHHLPPAETLVHLSRDTVAAISQLQQSRDELARMRAALSRLFWECDSSAIRVSVLTVLGSPPADDSVTTVSSTLNWSPAWNGLSPIPAVISSPREPALAQRAAG